jgi:hypothetical protein
MSVAFLTAAALWQKSAGCLHLADRAERKGSRLIRHSDLIFSAICLWALLTGIFAAPAVGAKAEPGVAVAPPGSVFAHWSYTHEQLEAMVPSARPEDVGTPEALIRALHQSVNGPKGTWNSDRFRSLCLPNALLADITKNKRGVVISNRPLASFIEDVQRLHDTTSWYEVVPAIIQVSKISKSGGGLAAIYYRSTASTTPGGRLVEDGRSVALVMYDGKRWWVVSDTW